MKRSLLLLLALVMLAGCNQPTPETIVITATVEPTIVPIEVVNHNVTLQIKSELANTIFCGEDVYQIEWGKNGNISSYMMQDAGGLLAPGLRVRWSTFLSAQQGDVITFSVTTLCDYAGTTLLYLLVDEQNVAISIITGKGTAVCQYEIPLEIP